MANEPGAQCFSVTLTDVGTETGRASCTWDEGEFRTGWVRPGDHDGPVVVDRDSDGDPDVSCRTA